MEWHMDKSMLFTIEPELGLPALAWKISGDLGAETGKGRFGGQDLRMLYIIP